MPDLSVIIVSWNVRQDVLECLAALYTHTQGVTFDVTLVDNASTDGTDAAVREAYPQVYVIANECNLGYTAACNQGIRQTRSPYVLLLNPDCVLLDDVPTLLMRYMRLRPEVAIAGPRILTSDGGQDTRSPCRLPTLWSDFCERSGLTAAFPRSRFVAAQRLPGFDRSSSGPVECLSGACLLFAREPLQATGLLDEGFFLFGEDADICLRLRQAGWQVHYVGSALVRHEGSRSTGQAREWAALHSLASRQRFFQKHRGAWYAWLHRLVSACLAATKLAVLLPRALMARDQRQRARLQVQFLRWCLKPGDPKAAFPAVSQ